MSLNLQKYIMTMLSEVANGISFLNIGIIPSTTNTVLFGDYRLVTTLSYTFILADLLLYVGIIVVIVVFGVLYRKISVTTLPLILLYISTAFLYCSLLMNLLGFVMGFELLSNCSILIFNGSYTFSMFSQILKIILVLLLGGLYILFPAVLSASMRVLELPILLQVCAALSSTALSSTNFALLLLALEGFSLSLYVMTALGRDYGGVTASVKYFAFGTLGSIFLF